MPKNQYVICDWQRFTTGNLPKIVLIRVTRRPSNTEIRADQNSLLGDPGHAPAPCGGFAPN